MLQRPLAEVFNIERIQERWEALRGVRGLTGLDGTEREEQHYTGAWRYMAETLRESPSITPQDDARSMSDIMRIRRSMSAQQRSEHYHRRAPYDAPEIVAARRREAELRAERRRQWQSQWAAQMYNDMVGALEVDYSEIDEGMTIDEGFAALAKIVEERK